MRRRAGAVAVPDDPWEDWERYRAAGLRRESGRGAERATVTNRLVRAVMWFSLAVMPASERWWTPLVRPPAIVQDHDGPVPGLGDMPTPLASAS